MKVTWGPETGDPYDVVADIVMGKYARYGCCLNFIVRLRLKYDYEENAREYNELIYNDGESWETPDLVWQNDWWEGEENVELLGCIPIDELRYPYDQRWLM